MAIAISHRVGVVEKASAEFRNVFLQRIAHEFKTPLNSINPLLELSLKRLSNETHTPDLIEKVRKYMEIVLSSSSNLANIVQDSLELASLDTQHFSANLSKVDVRDITAMVKETNLHQVRQRNLDFNVSVDHRVPTKLMLDGDRYRRILTTLVGNAIKYTFKGSVEIRVTSDLVHGLQTEVRDTGVGIKDSDKPQLFRFSRDQRGGVGLGLSLVKKIVKRLGGSLVFQSEEGKGSSFTFSLPYDQPFLSVNQSSESIFGDDQTST
jgi:two-component system chemotaxis sensor kinase CheA